MDKICIVKLRKNMTNPVAPGQGGGSADRPGEGQTLLGTSVFAAENYASGGMQDRKGVAGRSENAADGMVSLMLTPDQLQLLRSNANLGSLFNGTSAKGLAAVRQSGETIVLQFTYEPPPVRLLKVEEVVQMLRISRGYLRKIIRAGELKSYKLGRLRRIKFDDLLSYLEGSREFVNVGPRSSAAKMSHSGSV